MHAQRLEEGGAARFDLEAGPEVTVNLHSVNVAAAQSCGTMCLDKGRTKADEAAGERWRQGHDARTPGYCCPPGPAVATKEQKKTGQVAFHMKPDHRALCRASCSPGSNHIHPSPLDASTRCPALGSLFARFHQDTLFAFCTTLNLSAVGYT